jgi:hypothetical protein
MEEALTIQQRMKRSRLMKAKSVIIARKRERALNRKADSNTLQKRAQKTDRNIIAKKMLQGRDKSELSLSSRENLEKKLGKKKGVINKIAKKLLPQIRKKEVERFKKLKEK